MNMDTRLLDEKNEQDIKEAGEILRRGGLVAIPTETVYGRGDSDETAAAQNLPRFFYILFVFFIQ